MNSVERVKKICKEKKIPIYKLEKDLEFANGYIGQLKKGSFPDERLVKIADYLDVSTNYLMTGRELNELNSRDEKDIAKDLENIMNKIKSGEDGPLHYNGEEIDKESLSLLEDAISLGLRSLKTINKEKYNPNKNKK